MSQKTLEDVSDEWLIMALDQNFKGLPNFTGEDIKDIWAEFVKRFYKQVDLVESYASDYMSLRDMLDTDEN